MNSPLISVVMSCYNAADSLERAVHSMLNQSFQNFEFIIIDDGSTDDTKVLLNDFAKRDSRIKLIINEQNIGLSASLNKGIRNARAQYVARMDADDECKPTRLSIQFEYLQKNPMIDVVGSGVLLRKQSGKIIGERTPPKMDEEIKSRVFRKPLLYHPTILIRKSVFEKLGYYNSDLRWAEDADLWYRIFDKINFSNIQEPLLIYTVKEKLSIKNALINLKVKYVNLKKRGLLLKFAPQLLYDTILLSFKVVHYRP